MSSDYSDHQDTNDSDSYSSSERCSRHRVARTDRKVPRLCLDDALIMVSVIHGPEKQLASVQTHSSEEKAPQSPLKETNTDKLFSREDSSKTEATTDLSTPSSQTESVVSSAKKRRSGKRNHKETSADESSSS